MLGSYHLSGGAALVKKFKIGETITPVGQIINYDTGNQAGVSEQIAATAITFAYGVNLDTGVYSATQGDAEGMISVSMRPDLVLKIRVAGSATTGAAMITLTNTLASSGGTLVTDATNTSPIGCSSRYRRMATAMFNTTRWWLVLGDGVT